MENTLKEDDTAVIVDSTTQTVESGVFLHEESSQTVFDFCSHSVYTDSCLSETTPNSPPNDTIVIDDLHLTDSTYTQTILMN